MPDSAMICMPMHVGRRAIGVITLSFPPGRDLGSRAELAFFASLADNCAQAIERARAVASLETAVAKLSLLAEATGELAGSRDFRTALSTLARLMVPKLADWCAVDVVVGDGIERVAVEHIDPAKLAAARAMRGRDPRELSEQSAVPRVIGTGVSELIPLITDEMLVEQSRNDEELRLARELGLRSAMVVPMRGATTVGALTLVYADESGRRFDEDDLAFAEDIARRAGAAVENVMTAEAYRAERGASGDG